MDIVNEIWDTYLGDYAWSYILPLQTAPYDFPNATAPVPPAWEYVPATKYISFTPSAAAWTSQWPRDNIWRQSINFFLITWIFGLLTYFIFATFSYVFIFDKSTFKHPRYLKNQIRMEIQQTMRAMPVMAILTVPFFVLETRGHTKCYDTFDEAPWGWYNVLQFPLFIFFTDFCIYWVHRWLHVPGVYKALHKPHHKWIMPTPYASHAFHPVDGWFQALPYHVYPILFPLQKLAYVALFTFVNFWTIMIHDGEYVANSPLVNGAACHTMHHLYFNYNYGQYTTFWDRLGGSYRKPNDEMFNKEKKMSQAEWTKQVEEVDRLVREVEGEDDRHYVPSGHKKTN